MGHIPIFLLFSIISIVFSYPSSSDLHILETQSYLEGDLKFPMKRNAVLSPSQTWPYSIVPYHISYEFNKTESDQILRAMRSVEEKTCIKFVSLFEILPIKFHPLVLIRPGDKGCYATGVGYQGLVTLISLERPGCMRHGVIVHELLHVLGLWHEHMRYDRDQYVKIHEENIQPEMKSQFIMVGLDRTTTHGVPYDYTSIMHYGRRAFSKDGSSITIEPLVNGFSAYMMGLANDMSQNDILKVNEMYDCKTKGRSTGIAPGNGGTCLVWKKESSGKKFTEDLENRFVRAATKLVHLA